MFFFMSLTVILFQDPLFPYLLLLLTNIMPLNKQSPSINIVFESLESHASILDNKEIYHISLSKSYLVLFQVFSKFCFQFRIINSFQFWRKAIASFYSLDFLLPTFTIHKTTEEREDYLFDFSLRISPLLPPDSQILRHQLDNYCRQLTSAHSQKLESNWESSVSKKKLFIIVSVSPVSVLKVLECG